MKEVAASNREGRERERALADEIAMMKTKLSFEQQESKFKQDRLTRQLKEAKEQLEQAKRTLDESYTTNGPHALSTLQAKLQHISEL